MENVFETASRMALRFETPKGALTVEDLWGLPLQSATGRANLDDIAKGLHRKIKESADETSFVTPPAVVLNAGVEVGFEVVKRIIAVRIAERDATALKQKRAEEKQKILALIADKQDEALKGKSLEELQAMVEAL